MTSPTNLAMFLSVVWLFLLAPGTGGSPSADIFERWMADHGRTYRDEAEKDYRREVFARNLEYVTAFRRDKGRRRSYTVGLNRFADHTKEEFLATYTGGNPPSVAWAPAPPPATVPAPFKYANTTAPSSMDWRDRGAVTPIKDQGNCGSCWAFSSVASIESINQIANGELISLSEQELLACDNTNRKCKGGVHYKAFSFVVAHGGITTEANYPYQPNQTACDYSKLADNAVSLTSYSFVPSHSEESLMKAVANQPVSVSIDASEFMLYAGGIFDGPCEAKLNHEVTLVGYGTDGNGTKYWIAKNSWGTGWGDQGYILLEKDVDRKEGLCGLAIRASFPII
ncbi:zingipain-2-like [Zingiber officinale]|nr:zingipain-2-like [Zingiber officinale]